MEVYQFDAKYAMNHGTAVSEILNDIALMHLHQEVVPDIEKVIDLFSTKNRRLSFT